MNKYRKRYFYKLFGRIGYRLIYIVLFFISFKIWGIEMFEEIYFYILYLISYFLVGLTYKVLKTKKY